MCGSRPDNDNRHLVRGRQIAWLKPGGSSRRRARHHDRYSEALIKTDACR